MRVELNVVYAGMARRTANCVARDVVQGACGVVAQRCPRASSELDRTDESRDGVLDAGYFNVS